MTFSAANALNNAPIATQNSGETDQVVIPSAAYTAKIEVVGGDFRFDSTTIPALVNGSDKTAVEALFNNFRLVYAASSEEEAQDVSNLTRQEDKRRPSILTPRSLVFRDHLMIAKRTTSLIPVEKRFLTDVF
ncbi:MAG: hypothetical protein LBP35_03315 [Candidatus Ancillula trichonymphae]|nr:hypothetical protein [Candidatus Ancillula trichonymphae]